MANALPISERIRFHGTSRALLVVELLVFALPCYLIFALCIPLAVLGIWLFFEILADALTRPAAVQDLRDFAPFAIASMMAFIGLPAVWSFAKLLLLVFRGRVRPAAAEAMLTKAMKWATVPLITLTLLMIWTFWGPDPQSPGWFRDRLLDAIFDTYVTGLPLLIPAFHLRRILGTTQKNP